MKPSDEKVELLANNILSQAKYYLTDAGEFYPFGAAGDQNNSIRPIGIYWGEENPKSSEVLLKLEKAIKEGVQKKLYYLGAIGIDVYINIAKNNVVEKKSAIQINIYSSDSSVTKYFLYTKTDSDYLFECHMPDWQ
jgi:hypothetical protein